MDQVLRAAVAHLHALLVHFPITLLVVSVGLDVTARQSLELRRAAWLSLLLGTIATVPATVSGLIAHLPYEASPKLPLIEQHQYLAFATTGLFGVLTVWRWRARRRGHDIAASIPYAVATLLGMTILLLTLYNGHALVHIHGIGVSGVAP